MMLRVSGTVSADTGGPRLGSNTGFAAPHRIRVCGDA